MKSRARIIKIISMFSLCFIMLSSFLAFQIHAYGSQEPPSTKNCAAACLYDKTHKKVLVMENGTAPLHTSTSAKVMMGLLSCEMLSERLDESVTLTAEMLSGADGYSMGLKVGESIKLRDLLYGAICGSYNDAGYAIASVCAGSATEFVSLMNKRAAALGASATNYVNPLGYPDNDAMMTTLSDTLKIAIAASDNELYMEICSTKSYELSATNKNEKRTIHNRNRLVYTPPNSDSAYFNPICLGMNAGSSGERGGWSVITLAKDDGADYICIILGGHEGDNGEIFAYREVNRLIDWASKTYESVRLYDAGEILGKATVSMTSLGDEKVDFAALSALDVYIPSNRAQDVELKIHYTDPKIQAPIKKGEKIGIVSAYLDGELVGSCDVVLTSDCEANAVMKAIDMLGNYTKSRAFIATLICFIILLPAVIIIKRKKEFRHRRSRRY